MKYLEGNWFFRLNTLASNGLNTKIGDYAEEIYSFC